MNENKKALIKNLVRAFYPFAKKTIGFNKPVKLFLKNDLQNAFNRNSRRLEEQLFLLEEENLELQEQVKILQEKKEI